MAYDYKTERPYVFTEEGQEMFLKIRDNTASLFRIAGAARFDRMTSGVSGSTWYMIACVDRLVELKEIVLLNPESWAQNHVYVSAKE